MCLAQGAGGAKRSTEDMSAAVSREFGHSLADRHREGSATSDEVHQPTNLAAQDDACPNRMQWRAW